MRLGAPYGLLYRHVLDLLGAHHHQHQCSLWNCVVGVARGHWRTLPASPPTTSLLANHTAFVAEGGEVEWAPARSWIGICLFTNRQSTIHRHCLFTIRTPHQVVLSMNWYYWVPVHVQYLNINARLWNGSFYVWARLKKVQNMNRTTKLGPVHIQVPVHVWAEPNYVREISMFGYWHWYARHATFPPFSFVKLLYFTTTLGTSNVSSPASLLISSCQSTSGGSRLSHSERSKSKPIAIVLLTS